MRPRAFTLLEVVLTLTLFVMVASLVGPALLRRIAPVTFDSALDQTGTALRLAREDARRRGEVVFVYAEPPAVIGGPSTLVRRRSLLETGTDTAPAGFGASAPGFGDAGGNGGGHGEGLAPLGAFAGDDEDRDELMTLPPRIRFTTEPPVVEVADDQAGFGLAGVGLGGQEISGAGLSARPEFDDLMLGTDADSEPTLIAVFIPDGSIVAGVAVWLTDDDGRSARLRIQPAIGRLSFVRSDRTGPLGADGGFGPFERGAPPPMGVSARGRAP